MFLNGYFYWCGVLANALIVFLLAFGAVATFQNWRHEVRTKRKYIKRDVGGKVKR